MDEHGYRLHRTLELITGSEAYSKDFQSRYYARWGLLRIEASDDVEFKGADVSVFFYIMTAY